MEKETTTQENETPIVFDWEVSPSSLTAEELEEVTAELRF